MKWLRVLCRSVAFFVATTPSGCHSRTVQPVTYSYTTSNDGEYTETYQDGVHRIYNRHIAPPYSRHPSVLTHHYYDPPAGNGKAEHVPATTPMSANQTYRQTVVAPRKKNDYVAKVSYVRDPESVSFATTIVEDRPSEHLQQQQQSSTELPLRKVVVRKRRPLKPVETIPVNESNAEENEPGGGDGGKDFRPFSQNATTASPADAYNKVKQNKIAASAPTSVVDPKKVRKIRLKPTTTSTTSSTIDAPPMWEDVLHEPMNTSTQQQPKLKKKTVTTTSPPTLIIQPYWKQQTATTIMPQKDIASRWKTTRAPLVGTSTNAQLPAITKAFMKSGKYTSNYEDRLETTNFTTTTTTTEVPKPRQENDAESVDDEVESDEETEPAHEELEYPDEYNDQHDEEESVPSEEVGENAEHTYDSPIKLLKKPLRYAYSHDQKPSASDDHNGEGSEKSSASKKGSGEKHQQNNHQQEGDKGNVGFVAREVFDHSKKGLLDNKNHKDHYDVEDNHKRKDLEEHGHLNAREVQAAGKKAAEYKESGKHKKGHSTKGSHDVHKKNEYMKKHEFYDEHHEGDTHEKYNDFARGHKLKHGGALKHAHRDKDYSEGHKGNQGKHRGGHYLHNGLNYLNDHGSNKHYGDAKNYHDVGGHSEGKKWKYEKAKKSEDENESENEAEDDW